jgi:hypothetical protein
VEVEDEGVGERGGVLWVVPVGDELVAVVAIQPIGRAEPEESLAVLGDGVDGVVREPRLAVESLEPW